MSEPATRRGLNRPPDPAGTRPKVDPELLRASPLQPQVIDSDAEELPAETADAAEPTGDAARPAADLAPGAPVAAAAVPAPPAQSTEVTLQQGGGGLAAPLPSAPHAERFQFVLGALIALGITAAAAILLVVSSGRDAIPPPWSSWAPSSSDLAGVRQIAQHVGGEYRLPSGNQLVAVSGSPQELAGVPVSVAVRSSLTNSGKIPVYNGTGVIYNLCGVGPKCSITEGAPSSQRHLLLRREALELSLYTFRYISGVSQVEVFMPPRKNQPPSQVLFFRASQLSSELDRPLAATLTRATPSVTSVQSSPDTTLVDSLTTSSLFSFTLANQNGSEFLVLQPL